MQILPLYQITFPWLKDIWSLFFGTFFEIFRCLILISGYLVLISHLTILPCPCYRVHIVHKSSLLIILPCPDFSIFDTDFSIFDSDFRLHTLCKSSLFTRLCWPDFRVHFFTNPPSYLWYGALLSGCLILISGFAQILPTNYTTLPWFQSVWF